MLTAPVPSACQDPTVGYVTPIDICPARLHEISCKRVDGVEVLHLDDNGSRLH
jgi:hypothetical protein